MSDDGRNDEAPAAKTADEVSEATARKKSRKQRKRRKAQRRRKEARRALRMEQKRLRQQALPYRLKKSAFLQRRVAGLMRFVFAWAQAVGRERAGRIAGRIARRIGRFSRENSVAAANLAAAYPEKSEAERAALLSAVWENLACQAMEYPYLKDLADSFDPDHPHDGPVIVEGLEHVYALRDSGRPGIFVGAHIGNWELVPAIGARIGIMLTALYRPPTNPYVAEEIEKFRGGYYDQLVVSERGAALRIAGALARGRHIGVIVDQRITDGQLLPFFGRPSPSNPVVGWLAQRYDCPVHGAYAIRLPNGQFRLVITPPVELPRGADGRVDPIGANIVVHGMVEQWVRAHPEQWLWLHNRWRRGRRRHATQY